MEVVTVSMDTAAAEEALNVEGRVVLFHMFEESVERGVILELTTVDRFLDADEVGVEDGACTDRRVTDLAVADLALRKSDGETRCLEERVWVRLPEMIKERGLRLRDGIVNLVFAVTPAIEDDEGDGRMSSDGFLRGLCDFFDRFWHGGIVLHPRLAEILTK